LKTWFCGRILLLLLWAAPALAQKTDVIVLINGDRNTGEIRSYDEGRLLLATSSQGDIKIKWGRIASITSEKTFDLELGDGTHIFGTLLPSEPPGKLQVVGQEGSRTLEFLEVVRIAPVYQGFWSRQAGSFDLGFTYTEANQFVQFNFNGESSYRTKSFKISTQISAFLSKQEGVTSSQRASWTIDYAHFLPRRWFVALLVGLERNRDLGLNLRASAGGGVGRYFVQTNQTQLSGVLAFTGNREDPTAGDARYSAEAVAALDYSRFLYDFPFLTLGGRLEVIPSLTDSGRVRLQADGRVRREIISDFYVSVSVFDSYDSRPPTEGASKNDWGPVVSIGYKW
jgi:hypothetical protein